MKVIYVGRIFICGIDCRADITFLSILVLELLKQQIPCTMCELTFTNLFVYDKVMDHA